MVSRESIITWNIVNKKLSLEFIINMIQSIYPHVFSQFMGCFTFVTTSDFVGLYGQLGPFGWNVTAAIFKQP